MSIKIIDEIFKAVLSLKIDQINTYIRCAIERKIHTVVIWGCYIDALLVGLLYGIESSARVGRIS